MLTIQQYILHWIQSFLGWIRRIIEKFTSPIIQFDSGIAVRVGFSQPLAEGGFSMVYKATNIQKPHQIYALKRILCQNNTELKQSCYKEADVHRSCSNTYLMPLLGMTFTDNDTKCYMLFPLLPHSLRDEVNQRIFLPKTLTSQSPWKNESTILQLFHNLCSGVQALHNQGQYTHRDIKLENILLPGSNPTTHLISPLLMDFGSAGPLTRPLTSRRDLLEIVDDASSHTTMPYRPPELFSGELRAGDADLDYTKVDVWMLGCTLWAIMHGASPFECEFSQRENGKIKIVDCSHVRVLGDIPKPPDNTPPSKWYSSELISLTKFILQKDRMKRPTLDQIQTRIGLMLHSSSGGQPPRSGNSATISSLEIEDNNFEADFASFANDNRQMTW